MPDQFSFQYEAAGTEVLDCVSRHRRFSGRVDTRAGVMAVDTAPSASDPAMVVTRDAVFLHRSLFEDGAFDSEWIVVSDSRPPTARDALRLALGGDLAGYAQPGAVVASGAAMAAAALDVASEVRALRRRDVAGVAADGYRVLVDREEYERVTSPAASVGSVAAGRPEVLPVFDVWVDATGAVRRVRVRPAGPPPADTDIAASGWTIEYAPLEEAVPKPPPAASAVDVADVDASSLRGSPLDRCRMGGGLDRS